MTSRPLGIVFFMRCALGALLLLMAMGKLSDQISYAEVLSAFPLFSPGFVRVLSRAVPAVECVVGGWLVLGMGLSKAAAASIALYGFYAAFFGWMLSRGIHVPSTGFFGAFWARPLTSSTVVGYGVGAAVSLVLFSLSKRAG